MRYKVPQDVQRADKIFYFMTLKQLIILMVGGGITYLVFVTFNRDNQLSQIGVVLTFIPLLIAAAIAFVRIKGLSLIQLLFLVVESTQRAPKRHWQALADSPMVSITNNSPQNKEKQKKAANKPAKKQKSRENVVDLAKILDSSL